MENIDIDIDIDKAILQNIDIDKISNRFKFGISNRASWQGGSGKVQILPNMGLMARFWSFFGGLKLQIINENGFGRSWTIFFCLTRLKDTVRGVIQTEYIARRTDFVSLKMKVTVNGAEWWPWRSVKPYLKSNIVFNFFIQSKWRM